MTQSFVQGRLEVPLPNKSDIRHIKERVTKLGEPLLKKQFGNDRTQFWSVEFVATNEQWRLLEPELEKMGIHANLWEDPDLFFQVQAQEQRALKKIEEKSQLQMIVLLGGLIMIGALFVAAFYDLTWGLVLISVGFLIVAIGRTLLSKFREKSIDNRL